MLAHIRVLLRYARVYGYLSIPAPQIEKRFLSWVKHWNSYEGRKYGRVEVVGDRAQANISAVFFWGTDEMSDFVSFRMGFKDTTYTRCLPALLSS